MGENHLPTLFIVLTNVDPPPSVVFEAGPPLSKPGDFIDLRAEMNLVVGVTACSAEKSNNHSLKPIDLKVFG